MVIPSNTRQAKEKIIVTQHSKWVRNGVRNEGSWGRENCDKEYFGKEKLVPIYIEVEDGLRLTRALSREREQREPKYKELCRRFLADAEDFSEEKLAHAEIETRYENVDIEMCLQEILLGIRGKV